MELELFITSITKNLKITYKMEKSILSSDKIKSNINIESQKNKWKQIKNP